MARVGSLPTGIDHDPKEESYGEEAQVAMVSGVHGFIYLVGGRG